MLWIAAAVHHVDDVIAGDDLGSTAWFAFRTVTLLVGGASAIATCVTSGILVARRS
jgi:hypothetical protein